MFAALKTVLEPFHAAYAPGVLPLLQSPAESIDRFTLATANAGAKLVEKTTGLKPSTQARLAVGLGGVAMLGAGAVELAHGNPFGAVVSSISSVVPFLNFLFDKPQQGTRGIDEMRFAASLFSAGFVAVGAVAICSVVDSSEALAVTMYFAGFLPLISGADYIAATQYLPASRGEVKKD